LFANQRINEYSQTWEHLDNNGNLLLNFKTITRDINPQRGENQGVYANIPGDRDYPMFIVPTFEDNKQVAYDMYSMKQPFCVDLFYTVTIVTNKYEAVNQMNLMVNDKFKSLHTYIYPNNHPMPVSLDSINDESEYSIDDRKYYSQSFKMKVKAYIIKESDFKITKIPSRFSIKTIGDRKNRKKKDNVDYVIGGIWDDSNYVDDNKRYYYKKVIVTINFGYCEANETTFTHNFVIRSVETFNIYDFRLFVNGELQNLENEIKIGEDDKILVKISKEDELKESKLILTGFDPKVVYDSWKDPESALDEDERDIVEL
jgi:hypothetical protein